MAVPSAPAGRSAPELEGLLAAAVPFIDLRSPAEFGRGTIPNARNLPLLTDEERHQVGLTYRREGQAAAIALGEALVSGPVREQRIAAWTSFIEHHPDAWLYCWRGGLRSEIVQDWLAQRGLSVPRVAGGYKALRQQCLTVLERAPGEKPWTVLGGRTGSGKTLLLRDLPGSIDLEGLANHRGSAFGAMPSPQPTPVSFENALAVRYLDHRDRVVLLEDESRTIGRLAIPAAWHEAMQQAPLVILEVDLSSRAACIRQEYVWQPLAAGVAAATLYDRYRSALGRIRKRLGGQRHQEVLDALERGFANGDHLRWIELLLEWYYDPMYDYQLARKMGRVVLRGERAAVEGYLRDLNDRGREVSRPAP